jgi:hypothetical protein
MLTVGQCSFGCLGRHGGVCSCRVSFMMKLDAGHFIAIVGSGPIDKAARRWDGLRDLIPGE